MEQAKSVLSNEELIEVTRSLVGTCITTEDASRIIARLISVKASEIPLDFQTQTKGIAQLASNNVISDEQAVSWTKVLAEKFMHSLMKPGGRSHALHTREGHSYTRTSGIPQMFKQGELVDLIFGCINEGNDTVHGIARKIASTQGLDENRVKGTVAARLSSLNKEGKVDFTELNNVRHFRVLQFDSAKQAGTENFISRKEIENEFKGQ